MATLPYFATPENDWANLVAPYVRGWMVIEDPLACKYFFEGLPQGESIPWAVWLKPLAYWSVFFAAFYFVMIALMVILRKQWIEHERLIYPIIRVPLDMIGEDNRGSLLAEFFKNPLMWLGFAFASFITSSIGLSAYYDYLPSLNPLYPGVTISLLRESIQLRFMISFPVMGFAYLINQDVAFGALVSRCCGQMPRRSVQYSRVVPTIAGQSLRAAVQGYSPRPRSERCRYWCSMADGSLGTTCKMCLERHLPRLLMWMIPARFSPTGAR